MTHYVVSFLLQSIVMSAIILGYLVLSSLSIRTFNAKLRYTVWIILLVGLLVPMGFFNNSGLIEISLPVGTKTPYAAADGTDDLDSQDGIDATSDTDGTGGSDGIYPADMSSSPGALGVAGGGASSGTGVSPVLICVLAWGVIAVLVLAYQLWRYFHFAGLVWRWGEPLKDEGASSVFKAVQTDMGLDGKKIEIRICEFVSSTLFTGFLRPVIVLPKTHFEADELELIFRHELVHYKRRDLLIKLFSVITLAVHWFNPVVYLMCTFMQADGEASCDEAVLEDAGEDNRQFYAELMIKMIGRGSAATMLSTCFYGGKRSVKRRLGAILDTSKKIKKPAYAALIIFTVLTVLSGSVFAVTMLEAADPDSPAGLAESIDDEGTMLAREAAVQAVGGGIIGRSETILSKDGQIERYKVIIVYGDYRYDVDVDAYDGSIKKIVSDKVVTVDENVRDTSGTIGPDRAMALAIEAAGGGIMTECRLERKPRDGMLAYHVHIADGQWEYCMEINAATGVISSFEQRHKP